MNWHQISLWILAMVAFSACGNEDGIPATAYLQWVENPQNGLVSEQNFTSYTFHLQYQPATYLALRETGKAGADRQKINQITSEMEGLQYFQLEVLGNSRAELLPTTETGALSEKAHEYLAYDIYKDFRLIAGKDTIPCAMHNYEMPVEGSQRLKVQLAFDHSSFDQTDVVKILFYDRLWIRQVIPFSFSAKDLATIPKPKF